MGIFISSCFLSLAILVRNYRLDAYSIMNPNLDFLPTVLPYGWSDITKEGIAQLRESGVDLQDTRIFAFIIGKIRQVFIGLELHNNKTWIHLSISYGRRATTVPSYEQLVEAKKLFLGDRRAVQLFPKLAEHVNYHEVLHLYSPYNEEDWPLPDFRIDGLV